MNKPSLFRCAALASVPVLLIMTTMTAATQTLVSGAPPGREGLRVDSMRIDSVFAKFTVGDSPGCALGVVRGGRNIFARGYGMADLENRTPITPRTVFDIGSGFRRCLHGWTDADSVCAGKGRARNILFVRRA